MSACGFEYLRSAEKRRLDVAGSLLLGPSLMPFLSAAAIASSIDTGNSWPIIKQARLGAGLRSFDTFKLRTLRNTTNDETAPEKTFGTFDPRASKIGLFLRQSGIDEIPQLANVLVGEMSLVGHRPLLMEDITKRQDADPKLFDEWYEVYMNTKPGLIGESQIYRHHYLFNSPELFAESMVMDLNYAETATLAIDIRLILSSPFRMTAVNLRPVDNRADA